MSLPIKMSSSEMICIAAMLFYLCLPVCSSAQRFAIFSPDDRLILSTSTTEKDLTVWDVESGKLIRTLKGHTDDIYSAAFDSKGEYAISTSSDNTAKVWDVSTGKLLKTIQFKYKGERFPCQFAQFSPDGQNVAISSNSGIVHIVEWREGKFIDTQEFGFDINTVFFSRDGNQLLITTAENLVLYDVKNKNIIYNIATGYYNFYSNFIRDDSLIVSCHQSKTSICIRNARTGLVENCLEGVEDAVRALPSLSETEFLVSYLSASQADLLSANPETKTLKSFAVNPDDYNFVSSARFSHDGKLVVTSSNDFVIRLWDVDKSSVIKEIKVK